MIFASSQIKSGLTIIPASILSLGIITTGLCFYQFQAITQLSTISTLSNSAGEVIENKCKLAPNMFTFLFGENASQNINSIVISKSDLIGLTPDVSNTAESLIVAIIYRILANKSKVFTPKIDLDYWGFGYDGNTKVNTVLINFCNLLLVSDTHEIADYVNNINPNIY